MTFKSSFIVCCHSAAAGVCSSANSVTGALTSLGSERRRANSMAVSGHNTSAFVIASLRAIGFTFCLGHHAPPTARLTGDT